MLFLEGQIRAGRREKRLAEEAKRLQALLAKEHQHSLKDQSEVAQRVMCIHFDLGMMEEVLGLLPPLEALQNRQLMEAFDYVQQDAYSDEYFGIAGGFSSESRWVRGVCLLKLKRRDEAMECFVEAVKLDTLTQNLVDLKGGGRICFGSNSQVAAIAETARRTFMKLAAKSSSEKVRAAADEIFQISFFDDEEEESDYLDEEEEEEEVVEEPKPKPSGKKRDCSLCGKDGARFKCSRCLASRYCDAACQKQHWQAHKPNCK